MLLTKKWLDEQLNQIEDFPSILSFKTTVDEAARAKSYTTEWEVKDFFILLWATFLAEDLAEAHNSQPSVDLSARARGVSCIYPPSYYEIHETVNAFQAIFDDICSRFDELMRTHGITTTALPIMLLEVIERNFSISLRKTRIYIVSYPPPKVIPPTLPEHYSLPQTKEELRSSATRCLAVPWLAELIRFTHYGINTETAKAEHQFVERLNLYETANLMHVSSDEVLRKCLLGEFGAYLKDRAFKVSPVRHWPVTREIIELSSLSSFSYPYEGLVRLYTTSQAYPNACVQQLFDGG